MLFRSHPVQSVLPYFLRLHQLSLLFSLARGAGGNPDDLQSLHSSPQHLYLVLNFHFGVGMSGNQLFSLSTVSSNAWASEEEGQGRRDGRDWRHLPPRLQVSALLPLFPKEPPIGRCFRTCAHLSPLEEAIDSFLPRWRCGGCGPMSQCASPFSRPFVYLSRKVHSLFFLFFLNIFPSFPINCHTGQA